MDVTSSTVDRWLQLMLTVGNGGGMDAGFDPTQVNTLGVRFDLHGNATLNYDGDLYIDHCSIEYP